jgi:PAS domain-containing protein
MKRICCVCGIRLDDGRCRTSGDDEISHGFCDACAHHFLAEIGMPLSAYLEGIPVPVATLDADGVIGTANSSALSFLGKSHDQIRGFKGGDVFECKHARLPEGCGQTIHCSGCVIRNTATDTAQTGMPHLNVPAHLEMGDNGESKGIEMLISTEKKGGVVFLQIDEVMSA